MRFSTFTAEADRRDGDAATEILAAANASNADLIVRELQPAASVGS
jgi:nucleotide-binding universal stress UspA family protein